MDPFCVRRRMDDDFANVTVVDVYDQAASIGKEFEKMIDCYGVDSITDLMPKVIRALEQLEVLADKFEKENNEILELKFNLDRMEEEKSERALERLRYEKELEQIEEQWNDEVKDLLGAVSRLQDDNRRLKENLQDQKQTAVDEAKASTRKNQEEEIMVLTRLKAVVDKQREQIRELHRNETQKTLDSEALQAQVERLAKINTDLRRKNVTQRKQARSLLQEKVDLQVLIQEKDQQVAHIKDLLKDQENMDQPLESPTNDDDDEIEKLQEKLSKLGRAMIDLKDPNRPRFTLSELREVLMERNELKSKLIEVEEELAQFKPNENGDIPINSEIETLVTPGVETHSEPVTQEEEEEDLAVQGPINREPNEKLYPERYRNSGIRTLFRFVFGKEKSKNKKSVAGTKPD